MASLKLFQIFPKILVFFTFCTLNAYDVLVLADPIIDRHCCIGHRTFNRLQLDKGESRLIDYSQLNDHIANFFQQKSIELGGSAINVIKGLAKLNNDCAVIGAIGNDSCGKWIEEQMSKLRIHFIHNSVTLPTSQCLCFITPDGERTMLTYVGASKCMNQELLDPKIFENLRFFHLEGYQIFQESLARSALELAKKNGATISISLATPYLAKEKRESYLSLIKNYANILFCNEDEALAISGLDNPLDACKWLGNLCEIAVVTQGGKGGLFQSKGETIFFQAKKVVVKDTTGAGDFFSSGFIHAYLQGKSLKQCLLCGADVAAKVVSIYGVDIPEDEWEDLKKHSFKLD